jgi:hypothetical protein
MAKTKPTSNGSNGSDASPEVIDDDMKKLKEHLLRCQDVSSTSPAMQVVLDSLKQAGAPAVVKAVTAPQKPRKFLNAFGHLLRTLILDLPLMALFALYISTVLLNEVTVQYYIPQINLMKWNKKRQVKELTYYHRECTREDVTANNTADLLIPSDMDSNTCMDHMLQHGVSVYQNLVSDATATAARKFILKRNLLEKGWSVIANKKRYSFGVDVNSDPSVQQALKEIGEHKQLQAALRKIVGPNPAVIEFTGITAVYGAAEQYLHKDVVPRGSAAKYGRNFVPSYSLFIPLQDITAEMGSTEVCPGTHMCDGNGINVDHNPCENGGGMLVSGRTGTWKSGNGALLNQQLYHRGTAHIDKNGADRVLFILTFAGRPRFGKNQLESRLIGLEGSYSLKWDQWGHTMQEFMNPAKYMSEPWRTLRAMGLYKPPGREWGWDYVTVASMRIANEDTGYTPDDLEKFVDAGGYSFLPSFLKPEILENDGWTDYFLKAIGIVKDFLQKLNVQVMAGYLVVVTLVNIVMMLVGVKRRGSVLVRALGRLVVTHGLVLLIAYLVANQIRSTQWGQNIRYGKAFRGYRDTIKSDQPGTLPNEMDVLKDARYQSSYLASYDHLLDVSHPGNQHYLRLVNKNSLNCHNLPLSAKQDLAKMILFEVKTTNFGRLLKQNEESKWVVMSEEEALTQVHVDLTKASHHALEFVLTQLDYFRNELAAGVFRETVLHKKYIPDLLDGLQEQLIGTLPLGPKYAANACRLVVDGRVDAGSVFGPVSTLTNLPSTNVTQGPRSIPTTLPPQLEPIPPYAGAWVQEGDIVNGRYRGEHNGKTVSISRPYA